MGLTKKKRFKLGEEIAPQLGPINSILLFGYMGMGDAVMFEPTLTAYLQRFPAASFDVVVGSASQSLAILRRILEQNNRTFRAIIEADFKNLSISERKTLNQRLAQNRYDACLAVYTTPLQYFIGTIESIPIRIGHTIRAHSWYKPQPNHLFNISRPVIQEVDEREPYRHFRLAQAIGVQTQGVLPIPRITIPESDKRWAVDFIKQNGLDGKELISVHLGVSRAMSWKKWPDEKYAKVFEKITSPNRYFLFWGSQDELKDIEIARQTVRNNSTVFAGTLSIMQVGALLELSKITVGNDSGIGHLSVALNTPTFRIFGPSDHYGCEPFTAGHVTFYKNLTCSPCMNLGLIKPSYNVLNCGHRNCLRLITVEEVTESIGSLID